MSIFGMAVYSQKINENFIACLSFFRKDTQNAEFEFYNQTKYFQRTS